MELSPLSWDCFGVGLYGLLVSRNLIKLLVVLQILGKAAILALVLAGRRQWPAQSRPEPGHDRHRRRHGGGHRRPGPGRSRSTDAPARSTYTPCRGCEANPGHDLASLVVLVLGIPCLAPWPSGWSATVVRRRETSGGRLLGRRRAGQSGLAAAGDVDVVIRLPVGGAFGDFTFVPDGLAVFMAAIATVIGCLAVVFSLDYMRGEAGLARYYAWSWCSSAAMAGLVLSGSLLLLLVFWEIVGLCSFGLIAFHADQPAGGRRRNPGPGHDPARRTRLVGWHSGRAGRPGHRRRGRH